MSGFEVIKAAHDVLHSDKFFLLIELKKNYFFMKLFNVILPGFELLPLDAWSVTGGSRVRKPFNLDKLFTSLTQKASWAKFF